MAQRRAGVDFLPLVILLARLDQAISGVVIKLAEHQSGVGEFPATPLRELADQMAWMGDVIRQRIARSDDADDAAPTPGPPGQVEQP